jgi:hypothetical protein
MRKTTYKNTNFCYWKLIKLSYFQQIFFFTNYHKILFIYINYFHKFKNKQIQTYPKSSQKRYTFTLICFSSMCPLFLFYKKKPHVPLKNMSLICFLFLSAIWICFIVSHRLPVKNQEWDMVRGSIYGLCLWRKFSWEWRIHLVCLIGSPTKICHR